MPNPAILVRIDPSLRRAIERRAREAERTISQEVRLLLRREYAPMEPGSTAVKLAERV